MKPRVNVVAVIGTIGSLFLYGCQTFEGQMGDELDASTQEVYITRGMPVEELLAGLGEPREVVESDSAGFEIWVYQKRYWHVQSKMTGSKETPYFDPITGAYTPILDPVYGNESTLIKEETSFLIGDGKVLGWKVERKNFRDYH